MSNTITLTEPDVNSVMATYQGIQLERAPSSNGAFALVVRIPYVVDQTSYTYVDSAGQSADWYRSARYTASFTLSSYSAAWPVAGTGASVFGPTLARLEQETARRLGPYVQAFTDRQLPNTANFTFANFPELRSSIDQDLVTNLWMLRRGTDWQGNPVTMDVVDRQRTVDVYDPEQGRVFPDRPWGTIPNPGEVCEFHHLDPANELRMAVLAGLRRCFLPDTVQVQPTSAYGGIDVTAQFLWLTEAWQITRVRYGWVAPYYDAPFDTFTQAGHLMLSGTHGTLLPMAVWIDTWRPAWSWVNGAESLTGPMLDSDVLNVNLDYAASAAHIEAWHLFEPRLAASAAGNLQATRDQAAQEFTRQVAIFGPRRPVEVGFQSVVRVGRVGSSWINGPW